MTLKELRKEKELTQVKAAEIVGVSLRSYKQYENDDSKVSSFKYKYIFDILSKYNYIDEKHGLLTISKIEVMVTKVLSNYDVSYCYLFGSYAKGTPNETSDVDLLVATDITGMDFYGLAEHLREELHKEVDLLNLDQLLNNKKLLNEVLKGGIKIYERKWAR